MSTDSTRFPRFTRSAAVLAVAAVGVVGCGTDDDGVTEPTDITTTTTTFPATTTSTTVEDAATTTTTTTTTQTTTTTTDATEVPGLGQPAVWPAADVVFDTPEEAAEDFVAEVLDVPPALGEFERGDARSGEIEVLSLGEGPDATPVVRSRLLLRQLGEGWFVIGAVNEFASIDVPAPNAEVAAGLVTVEGVARGFEATVFVTSFRAGVVDDQFDQVLTSGGAFETPEPFTVELDLSGASVGDIVTILVRGGTGLETDPGEFGAIAVVISG